MELNEKLELFQNMIRCCHALTLRTCDENLFPLRSEEPEEGGAARMFLAELSAFLPYASDHRRPMILTAGAGVTWIVCPEWEDDRLRRFHLLGPLCVEDRDEQSLREKLNGMRLSKEDYAAGFDFLRNLPVISLNRVFEYSIMLHYLITGESVTVSDLHYRNSGEEIRPSLSQEESKKIHGTYQGEQEMLRLVREGNLNYREHMSRLSMTGNLGRLSNGNAERQMKNTLLVAITLFSRAAIEGGLSPETSFSLTDHYFQSVEACHTFGELMDLSHTMQDDFIRRVHKCRGESAKSAAVLACEEYIDLHLEEELDLKTLAQKYGYTEYYFSRKFKTETGSSLREYVRNLRIERAKLLLRTSDISIQELSDRLCFCSQNYFSDTFRAAVGMSPSAWREAGQTK